jgi:hypothetical protein
MVSIGTQRRTGRRQGSGDTLFNTREQNSLDIPIVCQSVQ